MSVPPAAVLGGYNFLNQMEALEWEILDRLAKARENRETNINLNAVWKGCGGATASEFAHAWGSLEARELVHGEIYASAVSIEGAGKITAKGQAALRG